jgi:hypothetical protein
MQNQWKQVLTLAGATVIPPTIEPSALRDLFQRHSREEGGDEDQQANAVCLLCDYDWTSSSEKTKERCRFAAEENVPAATFEWVMQCLIQQRRIPFDHHHRFVALSPGILAGTQAGKRAGGGADGAVGGEIIYHFSNKGGYRYEVGETVRLKPPQNTKKKKKQGKDSKDSKGAHTFGRILSISCDAEPESEGASYHLRWRCYRLTDVDQELVLLEEEGEGAADTVEGKFLLLTQEQYKLRDYRGDEGIYFTASAAAGGKRARR